MYEFVTHYSFIVVVDLTKRQHVFNWRRSCTLTVSELFFQVLTFYLDCGTVINNTNINSELQHIFRTTGRQRTVNSEQRTVVRHLQS